MAENKGKGVKGKPYDELSGVGTSQAGITGTTGNLNTAGRDGGVGMPSVSDSGNRQNADIGQHDATPALGSSGRIKQNRQSGQQQNQQRVQASSVSPSAEQEELEDKQIEANRNIQGGNRKP
jgi:hypothetical protein